MASPGSVYGFWNTIQKISPRNIENEIALGFKIAIVGKPEDRARLRAAILTEGATDLEREDASAYLREFDAPPEADTAAAFAFLLFPGAFGEPIGVRGANGIPAVGTLSEIIPQMLTLRSDLTLALARRLPAFRLPACNRLIQETSRVNATIAMISALPSVIPLSAIFLPVISVADVVLLTKNQIMLIMSLAAAFGQKPAYTRQTRELIGTVGSAIGWRQAARELVGLVPAGIGLALKASIAFSGTMAVGKAALFYYQSGKKPDAATIRADYEASQAEARAVVEELRGRSEASPTPASQPIDAPA
jgi:uncharacterized protein (DUF697 family)